jgi:uncharacterized protein involved in response to NO
MAPAISRVAAALFPSVDHALLWIAAFAWVAAFAGFAATYGAWLLAPRITAANALT